MLFDENRVNDESFSSRVGGDSSSATINSEAMIEINQAIT
jgi:hypothetical protein